MKIVKTVDEVREIVREWRKDGLSVGFVPTMGYLHEGHQSLIAKAVSQNDRVVVSVFVNPIQFGENEDLDSYPRDLNRDSKICENTGAHLIFNPEPEEMYGSKFCSFVDVNELTNGLCGKSRPGHFRGVCTVVSKLFNIVKPDRAYFGQKDAQQLAVVRKMAADLNMDLEIIGCPIVREKDGLAKSSRNTYLNEEERKAAVVLSKSLSIGHDLMKNGEKSAEKIIGEIKNEILKEKLASVDYVEIVGAENLEAVSFIEKPVLVALAVYIGKTRLIDNFLFLNHEEALFMTLNMLKGKIHRAKVVQAELDYVGSITIDEDLLDAAGILEYEQVQIVDINNGSRFETYTIKGERGSGLICLNGAAARCVQTGDMIIIMCYASMTEQEAKEHRPNVVFVDENNKITKVTKYEEHGRLGE